jgi:hypothetical protein
MGRDRLSMSSATSWLTGQESLPTAHPRAVQFATARQGCSESARPTQLDLGQVAGTAQRVCQAGGSVSGFRSSTAELP